MPITYSGADLVNLELIEEEDSNFFKLSDKENETSLLFEYLPSLIKDYSINDFEVTLFENQYLNAENDVFQVYEKLRKYRLGWMFPLSILESNENNFADNIHLNRYKFVAFQILLLAKGDSIDVKPSGFNLQLTDIYGVNTFVLILSNSNTSQIEDFSVKDYIPSLSKFGYYFRNGHPYSAVLKPKSDFCLKYRGKERIDVFKSENKIFDDRYFTDLFDKHLKNLDHHLVRFHLLYQVIEYMLTERFDAVFVELINNYNNSDLSKNDLIESINDLRRERGNVRAIIECVKKTPTDFDTIDLERDCTILLESHDKKVKNTLGDLIYDTRNLIVHNYRSIEQDEIESIENITHQLELLVINLIEHYSTSNCLSASAVE